MCLLNVNSSLLFQSVFDDEFGHDLLYNCDFASFLLRILFNSTLLTEESALF